MTPILSPHNAAYFCHLHAYAITIALTTPIYSLCVQVMEFHRRKFMFRPVGIEFFVVGS